MHPVDGHVIIRDVREGTVTDSTLMAWPAGQSGADKCAVSCCCALCQLFFDTGSTNGRALRVDPIRSDNAIRALGVSLGRHPMKGPAVSVSPVRCGRPEIDSFCGLLRPLQ